MSTSDEAPPFSAKTIPMESEELGDSAPPVDDLGAQRARAEVAAALFGGEEHERPPRLGRYEVGGRIGAGGMGVVYEAHDPELDRAVAIKLLHPDSGDDKDARARMTREARSLAKLSHPNVIQVYDVGRDAEDRIFIAMELVDGEDLRAAIKDDSLSWREKLELMLDAGRGLQAAHEAGLVHRDFKPENVLVARDGRVRVLDFGLARKAQFGDSMASPGPTRAGTLLGTPMYMAPEQYEERPANAATDQFAFAVTVYELLYGQRPFGGASLASHVSNVIAGRLARPPVDTPVPGAVHRALRRALATAPEARWPDVAALCAALEAAARLDTHAELPRRNRVGWFVGLGIVGAATVAVLMFAQGSDPRPPKVVESRAPAEPEPEPEPNPPAEPAPAAESGAGEETGAGATETDRAQPVVAATQPKPKDWCYFDTDTYRELDRLTGKRRDTIRARGQCWSCTKERRQSRIDRLGPREGCRGFSMCAPAEEGQCP